MDIERQKYISNLKQTNLRPNKIKYETKQPNMLLEQDDLIGKKIQNDIITWFINNPYPKDEDVHKFASESGFNPNEFETHIYSILSSFLSEGKSKGKDNNYDPKQVVMGIKVEMEHTTIPKIAEKISWDHLEEIPDYYTRLAKMEAEAGIKD